MNLAESVSPLLAGIHTALLSHQSTILTIYRKEVDADTSLSGVVVQEGRFDLEILDCPLCLCICVTRRNHRKNDFIGGLVESRQYVSQGS